MWESVVVVELPFTRGVHVFVIVCNFFSVFSIVELVLEIVFATSLDGTLVVGIETYSHAGFASDTASKLRISTCADGTAF